jgi:hypothetical protein
MAAEYSRNVKIHVLIALLTSPVFHESRATALDLDTASGLLLDVLHIRTSMANNLSAEVKARKRFEIDRDLLFRPFALFPYQQGNHSLVSEILTLPNSSRSTCSGSLLRKRLSSTRLGSSCFISSWIFSTASSRPRFDVLVTWRYRGGFYDH